MLKYFFCFSILLVMISADEGEIRGKVTDSKSGEPIEYANIFMSGTTIGSTSNEEGEFIIKNIPSGNYRLVVSVIGYETDVKSVEVTEESEAEYEFELVSKTYELDEVSVLAEYDAEFERNYLKFRKHFLGTSENASNCNIENPGIIEFETKNNGKLTASASEMLEIKNYALGYKVLVNLRAFEVTKRGEVYYSGETFFEELDTGDTFMKEQWRKNRKDSFFGSSRHFFASLYSNKLYENGFRVYLTGKPVWGEVLDLIQQEQPLSYELSKKVLPSGKYKKLYSDKYILVKYVNEVEAADYFAYRQRMDSNINSLLPYQISWIKLINDECEFDQHGLLRFPENSIQVFGYWGWEKMGDMLPFDYRHVPD